MILNNIAIHVATMSAMNASRMRHSHGGGVAMSGLELTVVLLVIFWLTYVSMIIMIFFMGEYDTKKQFLLDLFIPFRGVFRLGKEAYNNLD